MKTPYLIHVPKDRPTLREKVEAFKKEHAIWTDRCAGMRPEEWPWTAMFLPTRTRIIPYVPEGVTDPVEIIGYAGCWMDDAGWIKHGVSERHAIRLLCEANGLDSPM